MLFGRKPKSYVLSHDSNNLDAYVRDSVAEISVGIVCGCLPVLPRAFAMCKSKISSRLISYRSSRAKGSQSFRVKMLRAFGLKKSSVSGDTTDEYYQLREAGGDNTKVSAEISETTGEV